LAVLLGVISLSYGVQDRCNAIVLEGGGDLGAYEAGVLKGLNTYLKSEEKTWDVVAGVSVGALTSGALSQYAIGDELAAVDWLVDFWHHVTKDDVYSNWVPGGLLEGITNKPGLFNTEPLKKTVA
jgi:predicted acylesterase/phospholipase RssA